MQKAVEEFHIYIERNQTMIPNYGERWRYGETISTAFVESSVNAVINKRFCKKQQMQWSKKGAHLLLQMRTRVLNGELEQNSSNGIPVSQYKPGTRALRWLREHPQLFYALQTSSKNTEKLRIKTLYPEFAIRDSHLSALAKSNGNLKYWTGRSLFATELRMEKNSADAAMKL